MKSPLLTVVSLSISIQLSYAAVVLVDDFESGVGAWSNSSNAAANNNPANVSFIAVDDPLLGASNQVAALSVNPVTEANVYRALPATISSSSTVATVFYRMYLQTGSLTNGFNHGAGVSKQASPDEWGDYTSYSSTFDTDVDYRAYDNANTVVDTLSQGQWYNVWMVINNASDTTDYYINTGGAATGADLVGNDFGNRDDTDAAISTFLLKTGGNASAIDAGLTVYFDDIWIDTESENLSVIPEPSTWMMACIGFVTAVWVKRKRGLSC